MKVDLISYRLGLSAKQRLDLTAELINGSESELMLFCGWTLESYDDVVKLNKKIKNKNVCALLDVRNCYYSSFCDIRNALFLLKNGVVEDMNTSQFFAESGDIENNVLLGNRFVHELGIHRVFEVGDKKCLVLHCGELNILRNKQDEGNKVEFRFPNEKILKKEFNDIVNGVDIVLNPIHSPMGNQGKLAKRRAYLSGKYRYYFSAANYEIDQLNYKSLQYAWINGKELIGMPKGEFGYNDEYLKRTIEIE